MLEIIFLLATIQGTLLSVLLLLKKTNQHANKILAVAIFTLSIDLLYTYSLLAEIYKTYPAIFGATFAFPFIYGPIFYIYTKILTGEEQQFQMKYLLHFIPFVLVELYIAPFYLLSHQEKFVRINDFIANVEFDMVMIGFLKALHGLIYTYFSLRLIKSFDKKLFASFSNLDKIKLDWLRFLIIGSMIVWIIVALFFVFSRIYVIQFGIPDSVIYVAISILIYAIGYGALNQPEVFNYVEELKKPEERENSNKFVAATKYERSSLTEEDIEKIKSDLVRLMEKKKLYINSEITLTQLAEELRVTNHNLSEVINTSFKKNFYDFINSYRVEEFKERIKNPEFTNYSLLAIAYDSGFSSKSSFNSIFKKYTNATPSEYRKKLAN